MKRIYRHIIFGIIFIIGILFLVLFDEISLETELISLLLVVIYANIADNIEDIRNKLLEKE